MKNTWRELRDAIMEQTNDIRKRQSSYIKIGYKTGQADSLTEIGKLLRRAGEFKKALDCFQRALNSYRELDNPAKGHNRFF